jgi:hypothetical protein
MAAAVKQPQPETPAPTPMVRVTMARGKSAMFHEQTGTTIGVHGLPVPTLVNRMAGPGEVIEVAAHEVQQLIDAGWILDPSKPPPAADDDKDATKIELHEEMPGNFGLQRQGSRTDTW